MKADRQAIADQIADLAKTCGGCITNVCCGHGDYRDHIAFEPHEWAKFVESMASTIAKLEDEIIKP